MRAVDGIPGWKRQGPPERFNKEGLYGYIDGGAEIVLQYGFRELAVFKFKPAAGPAASKELVLEIYRMASGEAAFGLYSTKLEGGEAGLARASESDNWISRRAGQPGQGRIPGQHPGPGVHGPGDRRVRGRRSSRRSRAEGPCGRRVWSGCRARA